MPGSIQTTPQRFVPIVCGIVLRGNDGIPIGTLKSEDAYASTSYFFVGCSSDSASWSLRTTSPQPVVSETAQFQELVSSWHAERGATSSVTEMVMCRSYLRIIGMGPSAVPLILRRMRHEGAEPDMWFVALQMLTGADPVTEEARGDFAAMARCWLHWAAHNGYAW
jgi:hypothetical protein